jgi:hypothetical protein
MGVAIQLIRSVTIVPAFSFSSGFGLIRAKVERPNSPISAAPNSGKLALTKPVQMVT